MKKTFWIPWLLLSIALSGSAYSVSDPVSDELQQSLPGESGKNDADDNRGEPGGRYLGACCLRTGNTERMARSIRSASDSDLIVVEPKPLYEADYNAMPEPRRPNWVPSHKAIFRLLPSQQRRWKIATCTSRALRSGSGTWPRRCRPSGTRTPIGWPQTYCASCGQRQQRDRHLRTGCGIAWCTEPCLKSRCC